MDDHGKGGRFARGNRAACKHGLESGLGLGRYPKGCSTVKRHVGRFRRSLEAAARAQPGRKDRPLSVADHGLVLTACVHEKRRRLAEWWLASASDRGDLTTDQFISLNRVIAEAADARDRAVARLLASGGAFDLAALLGGASGPPTPSDGSSRGNGLPGRDEGATGHAGDLTGLFPTGSDPASDLADK